MFFLTSLIYSFLLYVIPGALLLNFLALIIAQRIGLPYLAWMSLFHIIVYALLLTIIYLTKHAYIEWQLDREKTHFIIKDFLSIRGCRWLNLAGMILITGGVGILLYKDALPLQFFFLYAAILIGFADIFRKERIIELEDPLPKPVYEDDDEFYKYDTEDDDVRPEVEGKMIHLSWNFDKKGGPSAGPQHIDKNKIAIKISNTAYQEACAVERFPTRPLSNYMKYVKDGQVEDVLRLAAKLRNLSKQKKYSLIQEVMNVVSMVRSIPYADDQETHEVPEYANFPIESLYECNKGGDCEDHAILATAILDVLGHHVGLFWILLKDCGHLALAYATDEKSGNFCRKSDEDGRIYYYIETVPSSEDLGEISMEFLSELRAAEIIAA